MKDWILPCGKDALHGVAGQSYLGGTWDHLAAITFLFRSLSVQCNLGGAGVGPKLQGWSRPR